MKEFIQGILRSNIDVIKLVVQGVPMLLIKNMVAKMLLSPQVAHAKLPTKRKELNFLKIVPPKALVDKEGWKISMLKGIYVVRMFALIQGI
jgi:hypothetical protein